MQKALSASKASQKFKISKRVIIPVLTVIILLGAIFGFFGFKLSKGMHELQHYKETGFFSTVSVNTAKSKSVVWPKVITQVGNLRAVQGITVSPQVAGTVTKIYFSSGQQVAAGDLIMELDHKDLDAQLMGAKAKLVLDQRNYQRDLELFNKELLQQSIIDKDIEVIKNDKAMIDQYTAQINYRKIRAPFAGKLGLRHVSLGQYIAPGDAITTLNVLNPIYLDFTVTQEQFKDIKLNQSVLLEVSGFSDKKYHGKITFIDNLIMDNTKGINVQATVDNSFNGGRQLLPNMFVLAHVTVGADRSYVVVPENAIQYSLYGTSIFMVDHKNKAYGLPTSKQVYVKLGERNNGYVAISSDTSTLKILPNEEIISAGAHKITQNNQPLKIMNNTVKK